MGTDLCSNKNTKIRLSRILPGSINMKIGFSGIDITEGKIKYEDDKLSALADKFNPNKVTPFYAEFIKDEFIKSDVIEILKVLHKQHSSRLEIWIFLNQILQLQKRISIKLLRIIQQ